MNWLTYPPNRFSSFVFLQTGKAKTPLTLMLILWKKFQTFQTFISDLNINKVIDSKQDFFVFFTSWDVHVNNFKKGQMNLRSWQINVVEVITYSGGSVIRCNQPHSCTGPSPRHSCRLRSYSRMCLHSPPPSALRHSLQQNNTLWVSDMTKSVNKCLPAPLPVLQWCPVQPGAHVHRPLTGSQRALFSHTHFIWQAWPKRPVGHAVQGKKM